MINDEKVVIADERHHFVPKAYLKRFTKNLSGFLFRAKTKPYKKENIMKRHIERVCFIDNFYTLRNFGQHFELQATDPNYIEKNAFKYESTLERIFSLVGSKELPIDQPALLQFIEILLSIKHRNPAFKEKFLNEYADKEKMRRTLLKHSEELKVRLLQQPGVGSTDLDKVIQRSIDSIVNDNSLPDLSYKKAILENSKPGNTPLSDVRDALSKMLILVHEPDDSDSFFITSDNPGFTVVGNGIYNTEYGKLDAMGFPINSKQLVLFVNTPVQSSNPGISIAYQKVTNDQVDTSNFCTIFNSRESIFCEDRQYLEGVIDRFAKSEAAGVLTSK